MRDIWKGILIIIAYGLICFAIGIGTAEIYNKRADVKTYNQNSASIETIDKDYQLILDLKKMGKKPCIVWY